VLRKPVIEEMKGDDVSLVVVSELSDYIMLTIPRIDSLHNFLVRVSNLTKDEEENVSEEDSDNTSEDKAKDGEEIHTKLLLEKDEGNYEGDDKVSKDKNMSNDVVAEETETKVAKNRPVNSKTSESDYKEKQANQGVISGGHIFLLFFVSLSMFYRKFKYLSREKRRGR
jgi:hypothetical protein